MEVPIGDVMDNLLRSQRMVLVSIILDALVLIVFGSFLLSRVLVKPLKDLVQLTQKISEGDFSQKIEVSSRNEIGQLIASFNRMSDQLKENQENLENHLQSLELKNKQLKQTQEELIRTEKLASIGRFAAGVAHEVGNPLGAILGYTSILEKEGIDREEAKDYLKRIEKEIERINRIVRELLDYARPSKFEIRKVDVNKVVENTLSLLSYQKNFKNIETQLELQLDLPAVMGDESQLSQVFINIVLNAIDAMPTGGRLRIRTEEFLIDNTHVDPLPWLGPPRRRGRPGGIRLLPSQENESSLGDAHEVFKRRPGGEGPDLRYRGWNKEGGSRTDFRSLFYHQVSGQRDGVGVVDFVEDRRIDGRRDEGGQRGRKRICF